MNVVFTIKTLEQLFIFYAYNFQTKFRFYVLFLLD